MIIDPVCAIAFEAEPEELGLMERPPRAAGEALFSAPIVVRGIIQGGVTFVLLALLFWGAVSMHVPEDEVRALLFFSLVVGLLALVLVNRAFSRSLLGALVRGNVALRYIGGGIALVTSIIVASPSARALLQFGPVHPIYIGIALATGALLLLLLEATKVGRLRYAR
jgi:Ca2+-transporting ATPase